MLARRRGWEAFMFFTILRGRVPEGSSNCAFLVPDNWDDWFKFRTTFALIVCDEAGHSHQVGSLKIGQVGLQPAGTVEPGQRAPEIPEEFDALGPDFFSLGIGEDYYASLNQLSAALRETVLVGLRDCAFDLDIFEAALDEPSMEVSLLRSISPSTVRGRLHRLTRGDAELTEFRFTFTLEQPDGVSPAIMDFEVLPASEPPTNVHVLIGRNGVGKTRCMRQLAEALLGRAEEADMVPPVTVALSDDGAWAFAGLVLISFSAFDDFDLRSKPTDLMGSEQVGLRHRIEVEGEEQGGIKSPKDLAVDFRKSFERCRHGLRADRWRSALDTLETDDLFAEANITQLLALSDDDWSDAAESLFSRLSSGHAIILLTITRLVELVDEKTLVLLDEPEGHLHPPLLAAFIRCLSDLLVKRNGVAIIATHSPVVLQEVPRNCAWKLRRARAVSVVERPAIETFGENIGLLTREVFGLEVTRSGFHQLLRATVNEGLDYAAAVARFEGQLGGEARAIVQALIAERDAL